jgi:ABC-type uncharacterized transport system permease subunit
MWVTVVDVLQWPGAVVCGYLLGKAARGRGVSAWLAYGAALSIGAVLGLVFAWLAQEREQVWKGYLIWVAWSAFGIVQGSWVEPRPASLTSLHLSGKER